MKTTIIKKLSSLLSLVLLYISISAQLINNPAAEKKMCDGVMGAAYVFEGKVISSKTIRVKADKDYYKDANSYVVQVRRVIKGDIMTSPIGVIQYMAGNIYDKSGNIIEVIQSKDGENEVPGEGIYFSIRKINTMDSSVNTNLISLEFAGGIAIMEGKIKKDPRGGLGLYFNTVSDFYNYISANYGIKIEDK